MRLVQKQFLKGSREFEILGDVVEVRLKKGFKEEKLTVGLSVLDPEPVINKPFLEFYSRGKSEPVLSLFINKPNAEEFNAFVDALKYRAVEKSGASGEVLGGNVFDEPPEFEELDREQARKKKKNVNPARVEEAIQLLEQYLDDEDIKPLLSALDELKADPQNTMCLEKVENTFNELGIKQGAVLTYAPYISILLSNNPY